ncbi:MAG: LPP20 family lipoprotein [Nitrospinae bacterium]|nr:LPP20 family lipoprotein [Nitrospinota bacterium]
MHPRFIPFTALVLAAFFSGCASRPKPAVQYCADGREAPEWTKKGAAAFPGDAGRTLYGRGEASRVHNHSLLRKLADRRAMADLARKLNAGVKALMTDYAASTSAADQEGHEQRAESARRTLVNESLDGAVMVDGCEEAEKGIYYSLAKLDADAFTASLDKHKDVDLKMKEYIRANARRAFESREKEVGRGK